MNIYEIDQAIMSLVDPETGEIMDWEAFEQLQMEREKKIENVACWYKNLVAEAAAIRQEELNLASRRKTLEAMAENRKKWLKDTLGGTRFQSARCDVTFRKTTSVNLRDEAAAVEWAQRNNHDEILKFEAPTINKKEVSKLLKDGVEIPGAEIVSDLSVGVK